MKWKIISTDTFSKEFKKYRKNAELIRVLDKRIDRLKVDPENVGGYLSGRLYGFKSTRIIKNFRLIFKIDKDRGKVLLNALDHRKFGYKRFGF